MRGSEGERMNDAEIVGRLLVKLRVRGESLNIHPTRLHSEIDSIERVPVAHTVGAERLAKTVNENLCQRPRIPRGRDQLRRVLSTLRAKIKEGVAKGGGANDSINLACKLFTLNRVHHKLDIREQSVGRFLR